LIWKTVTDPVAYLGGGAMRAIAPDSKFLWELFFWKQIYNDLSSKANQYQQNVQLLFKYKQSHLWNQSPYLIIYARVSVCGHLSNT